ncbi:TetR/AcrR family transcriptional regulator [Leuconostoc suionicum]|uniref:TetR/AcrR family transcriptional regulator n=1 Tax=Leuconostoc suionicum TaxID=1511761 RepID=UPI001B8B329F|nr:TetR/AcrR family transcriptional regulator [Leuconostoc suionicum]MBS1008684.1 TetR/AcrR family transcriptional regulator [Leuconostoc suionicum]
MNRQDKKNLTRTKISTVFINLVHQKGFTNTKISDITQQAGLSRGTFYVYFLDKYDLLEKLENNSLKHMETLSKITINKTVSWLDNPSGDILSTPSSPYFSLINIFNYLDNNRFFFQTLLSENGDKQFIYKMNCLFAQLFEKLYTNTSDHILQALPSDYTIELLTSSLVSIIDHWLQKTNPETPSDVAKILIQSRLFAVYQSA